MKWHNTSTGEFGKTQYQMKRLFPLTSFSSVTNKIGYWVAYEETAQPLFNDLTHEAVELAPIKIAGKWTQQWQIRPRAGGLDTNKRTQLRDLICDEVQTLRDRYMREGGYNVDGKWFHSDVASQTKILTLKDRARDIRASGASMTAPLTDEFGSEVLWKTMDKSFVLMTADLVIRLVEKAYFQELAIFKHSEMLQQQVKNASDPRSVNIYAGWPEMFTK